MWTIIAAVNNKGVIGRDGHLPWRDHDDMYRFKELTRGKVCLVGRVTAQNLPSFFYEGRQVVIISNNKLFGLTLEQAWETFPDAYVVGGAQVYADAIASGHVKYYYMTRIEDSSDGDVLMPPIFFGITPADILKGMLKKPK